MFSFKSVSIPNNIIIVGCGGTGSRLVPMLTQFIRTITNGVSPRGWLQNPKVYLFDDDVIEDKNIVRQNFAPSDVGKSKASVLANRYGAAYGIELIPVVQKITKESNILYLINDADGKVADLSTVPLMVILCVDSAGARKEILSSLHLMINGSRGLLNDVFVIDAGNEDSFGQVKFFNLIDMVYSSTQILRYKGYKLPKLGTSVFDPVVMETSIIPFPHEYYSSLGESNVERSCADLNQTLAINAQMAVAIMGVVQNYYFRQPMKYHSLYFSLDGGNRTEYLTLDHILNLARGNSYRLDKKSDWAWPPSGRLVDVHSESKTYLTSVMNTYQYEIENSISRMNLTYGEGNVLVSKAVPKPVEVKPEDVPALEETTEPSKAAKRRRKVSADLYPPPSEEVLVEVTPTTEAGDEDRSLEIVSPTVSPAPLTSAARQAMPQLTPLRR